MEFPKLEKKKTPESSEGFKDVVEQIKNLNWENLDAYELQQLMQLSYTSAREFAEALRIAIQLHPDNKNLKEMAAGELQTNNLSFEDYRRKGDHADFLLHFLEKSGLNGDEKTKKYSEHYLQACKTLDKETRAMSIFSREEELPGIFERILRAKDWSAPGLAPFRYYLTEHIKLDSTEGGHADLTKSFPINDNIRTFYEARLEMYRAIPKLFEK